MEGGIRRTDGAGCIGIVGIRSHSLGLATFNNRQYIYFVRLYNKTRNKSQEPLRVFFKWLPILYYSDVLCNVSIQI